MTHRRTINTTLVCTDCFAACLPDGTPQCDCHRRRLVSACLVVGLLFTMLVATFAVATWVMLRG